MNHEYFCILPYLNQRIEVPEITQEIFPERKGKKELNEIFKEPTLMVEGKDLLR